MGLRSASSIRLVRRGTGDNPLIPDSVANIPEPSDEPADVFGNVIRIPRWLGNSFFNGFLGSTATEGTETLTIDVPRSEMKRMVERLRQIFTHVSNGAPKDSGEENMSMALKQSFAHTSYMRLPELWREPAMVNYYMVRNSYDTKLCHIFTRTNGMGGTELVMRFYDEGLRLEPERKLKLIADIQHQLAELAQGKR